MTPTTPHRHAIDQHAFERLAADGHTLIPVVREVLSDLDTPLSVYLKLADGPHTYLFESVEGGETWGRYSIIGLPAKRTYTFRGRTLEDHYRPVALAAVAAACGPRASATSQRPPTGGRDRGSSDPRTPS